MTIPAVEIRRNPDQSIDEIVAHGCDIHVEQMDDASWFMQIGNEMFWFSHVKRKGKWHINLKHTETLP